ncbi:MAG: dTDP-4-dehydrorhamnose reductase [Bacteroidales bacterium]|nr:dTDP-4-dehydrorhamnose reductase [Bacteroidales bacterium]
MNILVTGANGQLGNEMRLAALSANHHFVFTDVCDMSVESAEMLAKLAVGEVCTDTIKLDITNLEAIRSIVRIHRIDAIVNCAAYTNVEAAEDNQQLATLLNAQAPANLAQAMKETGGTLVHISTDYVFGKEPYNKPCKETQTGTPTGTYGLTKLQGEQAILRIMNDGLPHKQGDKRGAFVIIRTAWLYSEFGKNFCKTMLHLLSTRNTLKVVIDQAGTPTYAADLAQAIMALLQHPTPSGIYHFSNEGVCSWFDFTKAIQRLCQLNNCLVIPCHSDEFPSKVVRPAYSVLDKTKIKQQPDILVPYWIDSLEQCLGRLGCLSK